MKIAVYCALFGAVLAATTPVFTQIQVQNGNVGLVNLPANNGQRLIGVPIAGSHDPALSPLITVSLTGTNLPITATNLVLIPRCAGPACCNNLAVSNAVIFNIGAPTSLTSTLLTWVVNPASRTLYLAYNSNYRLVDGGELCVQVPALAPAGLYVGARIRLYWSCQQTATFPARRCGTFINSAGIDQSPLLLSLVSPAEYANEKFGKTTEISSFSATSIECECINPANSALGLCGGRVFDTNQFTCCGTSQVLRGDRCPCTRASTTTGSGGVSTQCPTTAPNCCLQSKFAVTLPTDIGSCFNPAIDSCCDTGAAFDKGTSRCCPVNGVQSLDIPCPCETDAQCSGSTMLNGVKEAAQANMACCVQSTPALTDTSFCSAFVNFPTGTGNARLARCKGFCINTDYQLCCNGVGCLAYYEKCCNTTCCNKFIGTCDKARRGPDFTILETCSTIQQMNPLRAFWLFIFPAALLFSTLTALALALIFANKAASREFSVTERWMIIFSVLLSILIIPLYFSPLYKYGLFMVLVAAWTILTAAVRVKLLNIVAVILYAVLFIYLFDPFTGSNWFNLAYFRDQEGRTDFRSNGIWHTTKRLSDPTINNGQLPTFRICTDYFDYFRLDDRLRDIRTDNYRIMTFGYCSNQYILALYLFEGFQIICALILSVLAIIGLVLRFRKRIADPIELEVVPQ